MAETCSSLHYSQREIDHGCGVRQRDNLTPTLFMFVVQLVVEEITTVLKENNVEIINCEHDEVNSKIELYDANEMTSTSAEENNLFTCVDDGSFLFKDKSGLM